MQPRMFPSPGKFPSRNLECFLRSGKRGDMHLTSLCIIQFFVFFLPLPSGAAGGGGALLTLFSTFAFLDGGLPCNGRKKQGAFTFEVFLDIFCSRKYSFFDDIEENVFIYVQSQGNLFQALSLTKSLPFGVKTAVHAGLIAILKR